MLSLVLGTLGLIFGGYFLDVLIIRRVVIEGGERITADDVQRMIDIKVGDSLLQADVRAAATQLNQHALIRSARVSRRFFDLHVLLQERHPFIVVQVLEQGLFWCDEEGYVLNSFSAGEQAVPVIVVGLGPVRMTAGGPRVGDGSQWRLLRLVSRFDAAFLSSEIEQMQFHTGGVDFLLQEGTRIRLPLTGPGDALRRLRAIWLTLKKRVSFRFVDLRFPGELVYGGAPP